MRLGVSDLHGSFTHVQLRIICLSVESRLGGLGLVNDVLCRVWVPFMVFVSLQGSVVEKFRSIKYSIFLPVLIDLNATSTSVGSGMLPMRKMGTDSYKIASA